MRVEYRAVACATREIDAQNLEAIEKARALDREGRLVYEQDHETLGYELMVCVYDDAESLRLSGETLLVDLTGAPAPPPSGRG